MLIGVQTATLNAQVTFVNIAVAISALAGGRPKTISHRARITLVFSCFLDDFCVSEVKRFLGTEKRTKMRDLGCWSTENTAKTSVLDQLYAQKRVDYFVFEENIETTL